MKAEAGFWWVLGLGLAASLALSLRLGQAELDWPEIWKLLFDPEGVSELRREIIVNLRLPRALAALLTGGALALGGVAMQAVVRNPLADPYLLGVSAGASLGATAGILFLGASSVGTPVWAFLGAMGAAGLIAFASLGARSGAHLVILLGLAASLGSLLIFLSGDAHLLQRLIYWLMGSLAPAAWDILAWPALATLAGAAFFLVQSRNLNLLSLGDDEALALGLASGRFRAACLFFTALMTSACVAYFGLIGFVGLLVPHSLRFILGGDHRRLAAGSFFAGGLFLLWVDLAARTLSRSEIPLGVITGLLGVPCFIWILWCRAAGRGA